MASVLTELRQMLPHRPLGPEEALGLIERQTLRFLRLMAIDEPPVPGFAIAHLPRVQVRQGPLPGRSGKTEWIGGRWLITLSETEPWLRRRFTLAHELGHVVNHPAEAVCFPATARMSSQQRIERTCDYFAACLLMPRPWVKRVWGAGLRQVPALAEQFAVSRSAMAHRLHWLGLTDPAPRRCGGTDDLSPAYRRRPLSLEGSVH